MDTSIQWRAHIKKRMLYTSLWFSFFFFFCFYLSHSVVPKFCLMLPSFAYNWWEASAHKKNSIENHFLCRLLLISLYRNCIMFNVTVDIKAGGSPVLSSTSYYTLSPKRTYKSDTKQIRWISFPLFCTYTLFFLFVCRREWIPSLQMCRKKEENWERERRKVREKNEISMRR